MNGPLVSLWQKMQKNHDEFDGFAVNLFFDEDGDYLAHLVEMPNVSAFGPTPAKALTELKTAWQLMKDCYQADGEPLPQPSSREGYVGPVSVPVEEQLYRSLADEAAKSQMSLYALVRRKLMHATTAVAEERDQEVSPTASQLTHATAVTEESTHYEQKSA